MFLKTLKQYGLDNKIPNISWTGVSVLQMMISLRTPKKVLEMGCANGFSSLVIADALEKTGGYLLTGDISEDAVIAAKRNADACGITNIEIRLGNILTTVSAADGPFDLIFIDAQKSHTHLFFEFAKSVLSPNGIIIIDDTKKFAHKMHTFHDHFQKEKENWWWFIVPEEDDALMVLMPKKTD